VKFLSTLVSAASGSAGGLVASRNRYGQYFRRRADPVNPNTDLQVAVRTWLRQAVNAWNAILTDDERAAWNLYAANTPVIGKLGQMQTLSGQTMFVRTMISGFQIGGDVAAYATAPGIFNLGTFTAPVTTATVASGLSVAFTNTDYWAEDAGSALMIFQGRPQNGSRAFFKGPWRYTGKIVGAAVAPTSPEVFGSPPFALVAGQRVWVRARVLLIDGRLSAPVDTGPFVVS
jgi:hypothetical protein